MRNPEPASPSALRWVWPLQLAVLVLAALGALLFHARLPGRLPSDGDYQAVAAVLAAEAQPQDVVLLSPWWAERARLFLPQGLKVVGYVGSDEDPLRAHPRIWVLAQPRLPRADEEGFEEAFNPGRTRVGEARWFGELRLALYQNGRHQPARFTIEEALQTAQLYVERADGQRLDCPRQGDALRCPGAPHLYARIEWHEVLYEPRRCLYLHAPGRDNKLVLELPAVPLTGEGLLEAGYIWEHAVKKGVGYTTTYVALEDARTGERLVDLALPAGKEGFVRASVLARRPEPAPLRLTVQSQNENARLICVDLSIFEPREVTR